MKKITKIIASLLLLFGISSCSLFGNGDPMKDTQEIVELKEKGQFVDVTYQEVLELCKTEKNFVVFIKSLYCTSCYNYLDEIATILKEEPNRKIYCITFEYLSTEEINTLTELAYNLLGAEYYESNDFSKDNLYVPLTLQVVNGEFSNAYCGYMAAKYLRYHYILNFYNLAYFENVLTKFQNVDNFTLHLSTVNGDDKNEYLDGLYESYKNNPDKIQGYYFNLYKLSNEEKASFVQLINSKSPDTMEIFLDALPSKFELVIENKVIKSIKVIE